jgi:hypothetical protein
VPVVQRLAEADPGVEKHAGRPTQARPGKARLMGPNPVAVRRAAVDVRRCRPWLGLVACRKPSPLGMGRARTEGSGLWV